MLAFFQQQRDTSEKSAQSWKKRADEDFSKSSEMRRLADECDRCSDEEFPDLCRANKRIGHAASREARAYLQKSWEQLTSSRYDRETGCHEKNLVDPYRGLWLNYWRVLLDPRYDPQNIDPAIIEILAAAWNLMESANRMKLLMEQARLATGQNEIAADFVSAKLNASWSELSADQRLYILDKYSSWARDRYFDELPELTRTRFLSARVLENEALRLKEEADMHEKNRRGQLTRAETFESWIKIVSDLILQVEDLSKTAKHEGDPSRGSTAAR